MSSTLASTIPLATSGTLASTGTLTATTGTIASNTAMHTLQKDFLASTDSSLTSSLVTIPDNNFMNDSWMESFNTEYTLSFCREQDNEIPEEISLSNAVSITASNVVPVCYYHETTRRWK